MIEKMKAFCKNHREIIDYMLVGCGTTVAAWGSKYLCNLLFFDGTAFPTLAQNTVLSLVENTAAIAYAYPANRKWVFHSTNPHILEELMKFTGSRTTVWILGWLLNMLLVSVLGVNVFLSTVIVGAVGANANFLLLKLVTFRRKSQKQKGNPDAEPATVLVNAYEAADIASAA